jgi:hypothetical protein
VAQTAAPELPLREISNADFEKFLGGAPYGRETKAMLRLIATKAPGFARAHVLNDVMATFVQVVLDPERAGTHTYSRLLYGPDGTPTVILNSGVVLYGRHKMFFGTVNTVLPQSSGTYVEAGLPVPALQAAQHDVAPQKQEDGPWGQTASYADESQRVLFTPEDEAGYLLAELMRLDSRLRGWDASAYAVEVVARTAQLLFYDALSLGPRGDVFLDPGTRRSYRQWMEQPGAYHDQLLQSLIAGRNGTVDLRKAGLKDVEDFDRQALADCKKASARDAAGRAVAARRARLGDLAAYEASGLFDSGPIAVAREGVGKAPPVVSTAETCPPRWQAELSAMARSTSLLDEAVEAERRFRQEREPHAGKD